jgi:hypothetical protein
VLGQRGPRRAASSRRSSSSLGVRSAPSSPRRTSKSLRSAERLVRRARGAGHESRAFGPRPHRSVRSLYRSFRKRQYIGKWRGKQPSASGFGSTPAQQGGPERGLTTRCSGLATLAAELDIVRCAIIGKLEMRSSERCPGFVSSSHRLPQTQELLLPSLPAASRLYSWEARVLAQLVFRRLAVRFLWRAPNNALQRTRPRSSLGRPSLRSASVAPHFGLRR